MLVLVLLLTLSLSLNITLAAKPPRTALDVTILTPQDGDEIENNAVFIVSGSVLANRGDAGYVETFVQYSVGPGSIDFIDVDGAYLEIISGDQPQTAELMQDASYYVSWTLKGLPGTYEIRIFSQGSTAKSGASESRTVTILGPPPPSNGIYPVTSEYKDPETGYGTSLGTFENTYYEDGLYEVLMEEKNKHGTKNPTDDTADLGWIYVFDNLGTQPREDTTFRFLGHMELSGEYLDSGFLEWDDQDTAFYVQSNALGSWRTIAAITNIGIDRWYSVDVPDDMSETISLRIVDNDRGPEGKSPQVSSLYVDQAYIVFEPAFEYFIDDISFQIPPNIDCFRIADIYSDGKNEVYFSFQIEENSPIKYYEYNNGIWTEETINGLNVQGWIQVEDIDNDSQNEILTMEVSTNEELLFGYYKYDGIEWNYHYIGQLLIFHRIVVGNLDDDSMNEIVACKDPCDGYELKYYDYNSEFDNWTEVGLKTWSYVSTGIEIEDVIPGAYNEIVWLGGSTEHPGESALKYFEFNADINSWEEHDILNVDNGDCMDIGDADNDGDIEIVLGHSTYPEHKDQIRIYEYSEGSWSEHVVYDMQGELGPICDITIGDVDGNGAKEIVIGLWDDGGYFVNGSIRYYEVDADTHQGTEYIIADPDMTVSVLQIGDLDNDFKIELLVGLRTAYSYSVVAPELRYYKIDYM